jgi:hypothetical protein
MPIRQDDPLRPLKEPHSIDRWQRMEENRERDNAGETRDDWLERLIERKLRGES